MRLADRLRVVVLLAFAILLISAVAAFPQPQVPTPPGQTRLGWDHDGERVLRWELAIDTATPVVVSASPAGPGQWVTAFPALTPGTHNIVVRACNDAGCADSTPLVVTVYLGRPNEFVNGGNVRVVPPGS